ncbi:hypothetical protein Hdeb2414_s0006g00208851 [Helianthus debilis subsp. tardiflorus]
MDAQNGPSLGNLEHEDHEQNWTTDCLSLAGLEAKFLRRGEFIKYNLWVTPYALNENFLGGKF